MSLVNIWEILTDKTMADSMAGWLVESWEGQWVNWKDRQKGMNSVAQLVVMWVMWKVVQLVDNLGLLWE